VDPLNGAAAITGLCGLVLLAGLYPDLFDSLPKVLLWGVLVALVAGAVYEFEQRDIIERLVAKPGQPTMEALRADLIQDVRSINLLQWPLAAFIGYLGILLTIGILGRRRMPRRRPGQITPQRR